MLVWRLPASDQITECTKGKGTAMKQQFLHENWEMRQIGNDEFLPAAVPGSVYGDLLSNGKMENPFWKDNENDACELMEEDYEYVSHFDCEDGLLDSDRVVLRFDGIDTVGDVYLNEIHLGSPLSMHRVWEYDVKEILHDKDNELKVILHSPNKWIREAFKNAAPWAMTIPSKVSYICVRHTICSAGTGAHIFRMPVFSVRFPCLASTLQELTVYTLSRPMSAPARQSPVPFVPSQNPLL